MNYHLETLELIDDAEQVLKLQKNILSLIDNNIQVFLEIINLAELSLLAIVASIPNIN